MLPLYFSFWYEKLHLHSADDAQGGRPGASPPFRLPTVDSLFPIFSMGEQLSPPVLVRTG